MEFGGIDLSMKEHVPRPGYGARHLQTVWIRNIAGADDHRADGAAAVVDLGLGKIQGVLAFDIPGGNVVGKGEAEDAVAGAKYYRKFRFRRGENRIRTDADGVARPHAVARRAFEKDFGTRFPVNVRVHAFARAVLGIAEGGAGFVGAAASPHFRRMNGDYRLDAVHRP